MKSSNHLLSILGLLNFLLMGWLVLYLGGVIKGGETLEDRLGYQKPDVQYDIESTNENRILNSDGNANYTYVPSYSHIYANHGQPILLEATLSIRNTDPSSDLTIHHIDYFSSNGKLIKSYSKNSFSIPALTSIEYLSEKTNEKGGVGAYFVVLWSSANKYAQPIIETVMINSSAERQISFTSRGETMPFPFSIQE